MEKCLSICVTLRSVALVFIGCVLGSAMARSEYIPNTMIGHWFERRELSPECGVDPSEIEIVRSGNKVQVGGRSGDWTCTWSEARILSRTVEPVRILSDLLREGGGSGRRGGEMIIFSFKSQCERADYGKYPSGLTVVTHIRRQKSYSPYDEEMYIGSVSDAYDGLYRRCKTRR